MSFGTVTARQLSRSLVAAAGLSIILAAGHSAHAEPWPANAIRIVVPFGAGSGADVIARVVFNQVSEQVNQPVVIVNRGGAGGTIGNNVVAQAPEDGYTALATGALAAASALYEGLPYSAGKDLMPVAVLGTQPMVLVVSPKRGFKSVSDLVAAVKARPGEMTFASAGIGSATHLAAERFRVSAKLEATHVPFRGAAEGLTDVLAGRSDFMFAPTASALPLIQDKQLQALAVSSSRRAALMPDVPTTAEAGLAGSTYDWWAGLFMPAKTPREIVNKMHDEIDLALKAPKVQENLAKMGVEPMPMALPQLATYFAEDIDATIKLARDAKIPIQK